MRVRAAQKFENKDEALLESVPTEDEIQNESYYGHLLLL